MNVTITLKNGLKVGEEVLIDAVLRDPTAGDIIDAQAESERVVFTPDGPQLVASPSLVGVNMLRRQVVCIGNMQGPIALDEIKRLSPLDLNALQAKAEEMDRAVIAEHAAKKLDKRGRADGAK